MPATTRAQRTEELAREIVVQRPPDFGDFWSAAEAELAAIDPAAEFVFREDLSTEEVEVFDVRFTGLGHVRAAAWYTRPAGLDGARAIPGILVSPGYISEPTLGKAWSKRGYAVMGVAPRGKLRAEGQVNPGYPGLLVSDILDPVAYTYRGFYLDAVRAFDLLADRPEVDAERVGLLGISQGGGLGVVVAALRPDVVRCAVIGAPFLVGIMESAALTSSYPYQEINEYLAVHPAAIEQVTTTVAYYDGLNFADRIRADILIHLGLNDDICPPETGYALAHALPTAPEVLAYDTCGHDAGLPAATTPIAAFFAERLRPPTKQAAVSSADSELGIDT